MAMTWDKEILRIESFPVSNQEEAEAQQGLIRIAREFKAKGVPFEYAKDYYHICAGKCVVGDHMFCIRHECGPTPLPAGFVDRRNFDAQFNLLNQRIESMGRMFAEKKAK
jgi:hypothetical protein